jgi:hypothetical protein
VCTTDRHACQWMWHASAPACFNFCTGLQVQLEAWHDTRSDLAVAIALTSLHMMQQTVPLVVKFMGPLLALLVLLARRIGLLRKQYIPSLHAALPDPRSVQQVVTAMRLHASQAVWCATHHKLDAPACKPAFLRIRAPRLAAFAPAISIPGVLLS